jgi:hypothetical protein
MIIKQVRKNLIDVFIGNGWEQWSRFEKTAKGPKLVAGAGVTNDEYQKVKHALYSKTVS